MLDVPSTLNGLRSDGSTSHPQFRSLGTTRPSSTAESTTKECTQTVGNGVKLSRTDGFYRRGKSDLQFAFWYAQSNPLI